MSDSFVNEDQEAATGSKTTIRSSGPGREVLSKLTEGKNSYFVTAGDAMKVAVALAIAKGYRPTAETRLQDSQQGMTWATSSFDADQRVRTLVRHLHFNDADVTDRDIYTAVEMLADWGLNYIAEGLKEGQTVVQIVTDTD